MNIPTYEQLLDAGVHFGHLTRKWHPKMKPYIFMERNGIHIIDLYKTQVMLQEACELAKQLARTGKKILFVATKKQAKDIVAQEVSRCNMPYVTERWLGGMLTNFTTVRKSIKKMHGLEKLMADEENYNKLNKKERLMIARKKDKIAKVLSGVVDLARLPAAVFIVDIKKEHIAVEEARRLGIPIIAMVDTNSNPTLVDYVIPANDDAAKSIHIITSTIVDAIIEGYNERRIDKEKEQEQEQQETNLADNTSTPTEVVTE
ncbi:MAG: 30S ribosomal protein S2 [Bacteroidia bacterium]|nr:30S ribosomal protein S2 [Bacteroidia bacterium]MDW8301720.1 30S ribosomal protein S2 [Bacteroidia bacterium]